MKTNLTIPFQEKFVENQVLNIDATTSLFANDSKKLVEKKLKCIKKEVKEAWIKGYKMGISKILC